MKPSAEVKAVRAALDINYYRARDFLHRCMTLLWKSARAGQLGPDEPLTKAIRKRIHDDMALTLSMPSKIKLDVFLGKRAATTQEERTFLTAFFGENKENRSKPFKHVKGFSKIEIHASKLWLITKQMNSGLAGLFLCNKDNEDEDRLDYHISIPIGHDKLDYHFTNHHFPTRGQQDLIKHQWYFNSGIIRDPPKKGVPEPEFIEPNQQRKPVREGITIYNTGTAGPETPPAPAGGAAGGGAGGGAAVGAPAVPDATASRRIIPLAVSQAMENAKRNRTSKPRKIRNPGGFLQSNIYKELNASSKRLFEGIYTAVYDGENPGRGGGRRHTRRTARRTALKTRRRYQRG